MSIFRKSPYRWTWRTAWGKISHYPEDFYYGVKNWFRWAPVIWHDADFDWSYLGTILEYKLDRMAKSMDRGCILKRERYAKQMRECRDLVRRLNEDDYFQNAQLGYSEIGPNPNFYVRDRGYGHAIHAKDMHTQDQQRLGMLISKYLTHWWF